MTEPTPEVQLTLVLRGENASIRADVISANASPHTGRTLRTAESRISVREGSVDELREVLASTGATDASGGSWQGEVQSESYVDGAPQHQLHIEWSEHEDLVAQSVEFEGFRLSPGRYEEQPDDNGNLLISFDAVLEGNDIERFRTLQRLREEERYWPVLRVGVSDQPRSMRLGGRLLWSRRADGSIHQRITLVDASMDSNPADRNTGLLSLTEPQQPRIMAQLVDTSARLDKLLEVLAERGALQAADAQLLADAGAEARRGNTYRFYEVDDLADWD